MNHKRNSLMAVAVIGLAGAVIAGQSDRAPEQHKIHDEDRPRPEHVDPGESFRAPPSDAIVLFGGEDLSAWEKAGGGEPGWEVVDGTMRIVPESGSIQTRRGFGDVQLHIEFATDPESQGQADGKGQHYSNSGVFFMKDYELQILDSYENETYADGQAAAIYGQYPPLVNASRKPGEWQTYDVIFHRPRFNEQGEVTRPATMTVFHNGVLVQDHEKLTGPTAHKKRPPYKPHAKRGPIMLQDHKDDPIRFRNIWVRELEPSTDSQSDGGG